MTRLPTRRPATAKGRDKRVRVWIVVDAHGYPDFMYGPAVNGGARAHARRCAIQLNVSASDRQHAPWKAIPVSFTVTLPSRPAGRKERGK